MHPYPRQSNPDRIESVDCREVLWGHSRRNTHKIACFSRFDDLRITEPLHKRDGATRFDIKNWPSTVSWNEKEISLHNRNVLHWHVVLKIQVGSVNRVCDAF